MADKETKNINQWQPRERVNLNGNEGINIALDGNKGIFSGSIGARGRDQTITDKFALTA